MKCLLFSLLLPFLFSCCLQVSESCDPCQGNQLSSNGGFGKFYPRFLGNWAYMRDFDGNPEFYCTNCGGLRAYTVGSINFSEGHPKPLKSHFMKQKSVILGKMTFTKSAVIIYI